MALPRLLKFPWRIVTAIVVVAAVTAVLAATREDYSASRRQIADMPQRDRQRLEQHFNDFEQLSREQQEHLEQLHDQIATQGLESVLDEYVKWSATLGPSQRDELRKEADPRKRADRVEEFVADQEAEKQKRQLDSMGRREFGRFKWPRLSHEDLEAVAEVLIDALPMPDPQAKDALREKSLFEQYLEIYEILNRRLSLPSSQRAAPWPDAETVDQAVERITNSERKHHFNSFDALDVSAADKRDMKRRSLMFNVGTALVGEVFAERRKHRPDDETLRVYFESLSSPDADELMKMRPDDAKERLANKYRDAHPLPELTAAEQLNKAVEKFGRELMIQRLPPFDRRFGGPPGAGPPGNGPPPNNGSSPGPRSKDAPRGFNNR